jgi:predicted Zn-dependent protease with MMP-like domain
VLGCAKHHAPCLARFVCMIERHGRYRRRPVDRRRRPIDGYRTGSSQSFQRIVQSAILSLPGELLQQMHNVQVSIADLPPDEYGDELLLGLYEGVPRTQRESGDPVLPDHITIYRRPHELRATSRHDLWHLVRDTVVHEVAHHFGIDDDRLDELGWS